MFASLSWCGVNGWVGGTWDGKGTHEGRKEVMNSSMGRSLAASTGFGG